MALDARQEALTCDKHIGGERLACQSVARCWSRELL